MKWYAVQTVVKDNGACYAMIIETVEAEKEPSSSFKACRDRDIYIDWFADREAAEAFVKEAESA